MGPALPVWRSVSTSSFFCPPEPIPPYSSCSGKTLKIFKDGYGPGANLRGHSYEHGCKTVSPVPDTQPPSPGIEKQRRTRRETGAREVEEVKTEESSQGQ